MFALKNTTVGGLFAESVAAHAERTAVEYLGQTLSYRELDTLTDELAAGFLARGIGKGTRVGIWGNNRPATLASYLALEKIGAIPAMLSNSLREQELLPLLEQAKLECLLFDEGFRDISFPEICRHLRETKALRAFLYIGSEPLADFPSLASLRKEGQRTPAQVVQRAKEQVTPEDDDVILFTSGTVSVPKAVLTSHYARVNSALAHIDSLELTPEDRSCIAIPMFHCFSLTAGVLAALFSGACVYFPENRRTQTILRAISLDRCTVFNAVPTLFSAILARNDLDQYDLSPLRTGFVGGSIYQPAFFERISRELQFDPLPGLGQTEACAGFTFCSLHDPLELRARTIGRIMAYTECKIVDPTTGETLPCGKSGEICIRGFSVMKRYLAFPELTASTVDAEGWLHTGDLASLDEEGYLYMTGRLKDMIIRGGENISPTEIEELLAQEARIAEVKVIGVPDSHYGEELCACVVLRPGCTMEAEEVRDCVRARLSYYKVPRYVLFPQSLPVTNSGKIALGQLTDYAVAALHLA